MRAVLLLILISFPRASAAECPAQYASFLSLEERVAGNLGYLPESQHRTGVRGLNEEIHLLDRAGKTIGYFQYRLVGRRLMVKSVNVREEDRRKGVSELLLARVLERNPEADSMATDLAFDNSGQFYKARRQGLSCEEAIRSTPAFRARVKLGFTKLLSFECGEAKEEGLGFVIGR